MARTIDHRDLVLEEARRDPSFRDEWDETTPARAVAVALINYRADHNLTQRRLAELLGVKQPYVARLESGETNPDIKTLIRLSRVLGIEFVLDIAPPGRRPKLVANEASDGHTATDRQGVTITFATG